LLLYVTSAAVRALTIKAAGACFALKDGEN